MVTSGSDADADDAAALLRLVFDGDLSTAAGLRHRFASMLPSDGIAWWKATDGGRFVGWAVAGLNTFAAEPGRAFASVAVHPDERGQGHGTGLWEAVSRHLQGIGASTTAVGTRGDEASARFARSRGFVHASTDTMLAVDPRGIERGAVPENIELHPLSAFADDPAPVYRCDAEAAQDEPGPFDLDGITFDDWRRQIWEQPELDRHLSVAAVSDDHVVGATLLFTDRTTGHAVNGGTGVVRNERGRGIGLSMKQASLASAGEHGITRVVTHNDATNAPMLAINRRLGYAPFATGQWWVLERGQS